LEQFPLKASMSIFEPVDKTWPENMKGISHLTSYNSIL